MRREARISGERSAGRDRRVALGEGDHAAHLVGELPDVARPAVEHEVFEHLVGDRQAALLLFVG